MLIVGRMRLPPCLFEIYCCPVNFKTAISLYIMYPLRQNYHPLCFVFRQLTIRTLYSPAYVNNLCLWWRAAQQLTLFTIRNAFLCFDLHFVPSALWWHFTASTPIFTEETRTHSRLAEQVYKHAKNMFIFSSINSTHLHLLNINFGQLSRNTILIINDLQIAICKKLILYILVDYTVDSISWKAVFFPTFDVSDRFLEKQRRTRRENRVCPSKRFFILFFFED